MKNLRLNRAFKHVAYLNLLYILAVGLSYFLIGVGATLFFNAMGLSISAWLLPICILWIAVCILYFGEGGM